MRAVLAAAMLVLAMGSSCSRKPEASRKHRVAASVEEPVAVESACLDLDGRENALGAPCEVAVRNPSAKAVERQYRVVYFSHTGAELLRADHDEEEW